RPGSGHNGLLSGARSPVGLSCCKPEGAMIDGRTILTAAMPAIAGPVSTRIARAQPAMSRITAYAFSFPALAGGDIRLGDYAGRPLLIVNTAALCGFTPQYAGLQELWTQFHGRGLMII